MSRRLSMSPRTSVMEQPPRPSPAGFSDRARRPSEVMGSPRDLEGPRVPESGRSPRDPAGVPRPGRDTSARSPRSSAELAALPVSGAARRGSPAAGSPDPSALTAPPARRGSAHEGGSSASGASASGAQVA
eukprot:1027904-Prorocentrum_minimum.AAC.1